MHLYQYVKEMKMKPLIKWAGGKSREIKYVEKIIPKFDRYVEPFFGGGAMFFDLEPSKAVINDISEELITFYKLLKNGKSGEKFKQELYKYVEAWERIKVYMQKFGNDFLELYNWYKVNKINDKEFDIELKELFCQKIIPFNGLFKQEFCINQKSFLNEIESSLSSKLKRTKIKVDTKNKFSDSEIMKNVESAFRSGFYMHFRDIMNKDKKGEITLEKEKRIANWYFIREFCYGGMFRYGRQGNFNVPYGGIGYNSKDFRGKVDYIFSKNVRALLDKTQVEN